MRYIQALLILALAAPVAVFAADKPTNLEPLEDLPPPPAGLSADDSVEPQITITKKGDDKVEEYRIHGELYMMKITPSHGVPYYLMKEDENSAWSRLDGPTPPMIIPKWVLFTF